MNSDWFKKQMSFYYGNSKENGHRFFAALGGWEIALIVAAVILIFGVGKLGNVGGALGKSIREFRKEKDKIDTPPQLNTKDNKEADNDQSDTKSQE